MSKKKFKGIKPFKHFINNFLKVCKENDYYVGTRFDPVPEKLFLNDKSGFFFGQDSCDQDVGLPLGEPGHIAVIGGSGSGKTSCVVIPTMSRYGGSIIATDINGMISDKRVQEQRKGKLLRPLIVFDFFDIKSKSYDPFSFVHSNGSQNVLRNIIDIANSLVSIPENCREPFWYESERALLAAALLHYDQQGLSFSEALVKITSLSTSELCKALKSSTDERVKMMLGEISSAKSETIASIDRGLRNKLIPIATDENICHSLRGSREGADIFSWSDMDKYDIFLRVPEDKLEHCGPALNLMYTQLLRYFERRPDRYSDEGKNIQPVLLLLDEFPRMGKLTPIVNAVATLRCKNVNICLVVQSMSQFDKTYGISERQIIIDNCSFKAILNASDPGTQEYLSSMIGTREKGTVCSNMNYTSSNTVSSHSHQISVQREPLVFPHEFSNLDNDLILVAGKAHRLQKCRCYMEESYFDVNQGVVIQATAERINKSKAGNNLVIKAKSHKELAPNMSDDIKMLTTKERLRNADKHILKSEVKLLGEDTCVDVDERVLDLGTLVATEFPALLKNTDEDDNYTEITLGKFKQLLNLIATDKETVRILLRRVNTP